MRSERLRSLAIAFTSRKARPHDGAELVVDLALLPAEVLHVLHPLEVRDDHAARVGEHVGDDVDALVVEDVVGGRSRRAVGALEQDLAARSGRRCPRRIIPPSAAGTNTSHSMAIRSSGVDRARRARNSGSLPPASDELVQVARGRCPRRCGSRRSRPRRRSTLHAELVHDARRVVADVAEALDDAGRVGRAEAELRSRLAEAGR